MPAGFLEFLAAAVVMELTPGPNMTWLVLLSARAGWRAGLQAVAGITSGLALMGGVAASGAAALIAAYPLVYETLRWAGVIFLLYLAFEAWVGEKAGAARDDKGRHFRRGFLVNNLNPKAAAVFLVMIPAFAGTAGAGWLIVMSTIYLAIATTAHALIAVFASNLQQIVVDPRREVIVRRILAILLGSVAIWFGLSTGRQA